MNKKIIRQNIYNIIEDRLREFAAAVMDLDINNNIKEIKKRNKKFNNTILLRKIINVA